MVIVGKIYEIAGFISAANELSSITCIGTFFNIKKIVNVGTACHVNYVDLIFPTITIFYKAYWNVSITYEVQYTIIIFTIYIRCMV